MDDGTVGLVEPARKLKRIIGRHGGVLPGPTVLAMGGIHGNEPAGIIAARRVLEGLRRLAPKFRGEIVFLVGNLPALEQRVRYLQRDLNRIWIPGEVESTPSEPSPRGRTVEDRERKSILDRLDGFLAGFRGDAYLLDMHTSSAPGCPFMTVGDTIRNRRIAMQFPLPLILGLEEQVDGALLEYMNNRGLVTLGVEAGQHDDPSSARHMEAVLWCVMVATGQIDADAVPDFERFREHLGIASSGVPPVVEVRHRHPIAPGDEFVMEPGFTNFQPVRRGRVLARDREGIIRAHEDGLVLLPLYQGLGDDGFFLCREVRPIWMKLSWVVRRMRLGAAMRFLPGVRVDPADADAWFIDTRVARLFPLEIFHLLGFRKLRQQGSILVVGRRKHDFERPERYF